MAASKPKAALALPDPTYKIPSSDQELRMSYGMFNDIMRIVGAGQDASTLLMTDAMTRDLVIRRLFTDNKKPISADEELINAFEIEVLPSELDGVLAWVTDHISHFLLSTGKTMQTVLEKYRVHLPAPAEAKSENQS